VGAVPLHPDGVQLELVSWDVDGTLYSLPRLRLAIAARVLGGVWAGRLGRDLAELRALSRWRTRMELVRAAGGDVAAACARAGEARWREQREHVRALERSWYGQAIARVGLRREVGPLHAALRARGVRQIVLSDYDSDYKLAALGLSDAFEAIYSGESLGWLKPSTELYRGLAERLGVAPERWLHIGDRVDRDQEPARALGCQTLLIGRDRPPAWLLSA
jgi:HAD superfamily hydrolase (TIGR01549 family)